MMIRKAAEAIRSEQATETFTLSDGSVLDVATADDGERLLTLHVNDTAGFPGARLEVLD